MSGAGGTSQGGQTADGRLSVVTITKNEERNIRDCLETVRWADEIIVVDAESSDRTVSIAKEYTDHVLVRRWSGYGPQKNVAIDEASGEWILVVDADERVTKPLGEEIRRVVRSGPPADVAGFQIPRRNFFYGRWIRGSGMSPDRQLRLFRRSAGRYDDTALHERLVLRGKILKLACPLDHLTMPTVGGHVKKMMWYTTLGAQEKLKRRSRITALDIAVSHLATLFRTYVTRRGFVDGVHGVVIAGFAGMHTFVKYAKAWESLEAERETGHEPR